MYIRMCIHDIGLCACCAEISLAASVSLCLQIFFQWYSFRTHLVSDDLATKFIQFSDDDETKEFLENCKEKSDQLFTQLFHSIVKLMLSWTMNKTSINGYET